MRRAVFIVMVLAAMVPVATADQAVVVSAAEPERTLSLTVYNVGRALVRDAREIQMPRGTVALEFRDIAARVMPQTVSVRGEGVTVLEQNYEYDLLSPQTLLAKFLGRTVTLVLDEPGPEPGQVVRQEAEGILLSMESGTVWRIGDRIVTNPPYRHLIFDSVPGTLRERPTLVWLLDVSGSGARRVEATYLTGGITWQADYVLTLEERGDRGALQGWVTLDNNSGAAYPDATLQLVAGDVHVVRDQVGRPDMVLERAVAAAPQMVEESFAEYHLYTLQRPTTIGDRQKKQVSLLEADGIRVVRRYRVEAPSFWFRSRIGLQRQDVTVQLEVANRSENRLGMPLPAGVVRMYQRDRRGTAQFIGEDRIGHTPRDETVTLTMGRAFDVVAERRQTEYRRLADTLTETAFEVVVRNHKDDPISVEVREGIGGDWEMLSHSHPFEKVSAFGVVFTVPVAARGEARLTYKVRTRH